MKVILSFYILLISLNCNSQSRVYRDSHFGIYTDSINGENTTKITKDLDEFIIIKNYNQQIIQSEVNEDEENVSDSLKKINSFSRAYQEFTKYLIYKIDNKIFVKKYDNFGEYNSVEIKNNSIFPFLNKNIRKIKKEKLKNYRIKTVSDDNKTTYEYSIVPLPIYREIHLKSKNIISTTKYHYFDMENENNENINFAENMKLKVIKLEIMCKNEIEKLEKSKRFVRV